MVGDVHGRETELLIWMAIVYLFSLTGRLVGLSSRRPVGSATAVLRTYRPPFWTYFVAAFGLLLQYPHPTVVCTAV